MQWLFWNIVSEFLYCQHSDFKYISSDHANILISYMGLFRKQTTIVGLGDVFQQCW
jgi:hypothetical protein